MAFVTIESLMPDVLKFARVEVAVADRGGARDRYTTSFKSHMIPYLPLLLIILLFTKYIQTSLLYIIMAYYLSVVYLSL